MGCGASAAETGDQPGGDAPEDGAGKDAPADPKKVGLFYVLSWLCDMK